MPQPIIQLQRRAQIVGELRMGEQVQTGSNKTRPSSLEQWRLTSRDEHLLGQVAKMYGGEVRPWDGNPGEYELYTESSEIIIRVHPNLSVPSQNYEFWGQNGCLRRCGGDGTDCQVTDDKTGERSMTPCFCDSLPEKEQCDLITRVKFEIAGVPTLGLWSFQTKGIYAALELPAQIEMLLEKFGTSTLAGLAIEPREIERQGQPKKKFKVPVIRYRETLGEQVLALGGSIEVNPANVLAPVHIQPLKAHVNIVSDAPSIHPQEDVVQDAVFVEEHPDIQAVDPTSREGKSLQADQTIGINESNGAELKVMLKATGVDVKFIDFKIAQWESGCNNVGSFRDAIIKLNPVAFDPDKPAEEKSPFDDDSTQESLGGLQ